MGTLYVWANPLADAPFVDHTWVTDFPFVNGEYRALKDIPEGASYWFCWGEYHPAGNGGIYKNPNGTIGQGEGSIRVAQQLVWPNVEPPKFPGKPMQPQDGAIMFYGVDGVCHNVANQALYGTGSVDREPLRVKDASGYHISTFFYGNYGLDHKSWKRLKRQAGDILEPEDDFSSWMNETLPEAVGEIERLEVEAARGIAHAALREVHENVASGALDNSTVIEATLVAIWLASFEAVKFAVGDENFLKLFPALADLSDDLENAAHWIDRTMLDQSFEAHRPRND